MGFRGPVGDALRHRVRPRPHDVGAELPAVGAEGEGEQPGGTDQILRLAALATCMPRRAAACRCCLRPLSRLRLSRRAHAAWPPCRRSCRRPRATTSPPAVAPVGPHGTPARGCRPIVRGFPPGRFVGRRGGHHTCRTRRRYARSLRLTFGVASPPSVAPRCALVRLGCAQVVAVGVAAFPPSRPVVAEPVKERRAGDAQWTDSAGQLAQRLEGVAVVERDVRV